MSARLPVEILEKVVSNFDPYGSVQALDLLSLSQVSRDWHNVALPAVHKTIYIQNPRDKTLSAILSFLQRFGIAGVTDSHNETVWDWGDDSDIDGEYEGPPVERGAARVATDAPTQRLWHCYNESEKLAALPREIYFQGPFESASAASAIRRFLHVCPNVRSIRLFHKPTMDSFQMQMHRRRDDDEDEDGGHSTDLFRIIAKMRPDLERLEATTLSYDQDYILYNLHDFPKMTDLRLYYADDGEAQEFLKLPEAGACNFKLRTFELGAGPRTGRLKEVALHGIDGHWKAIGDVVATLPPTVTYLEVCPSDEVTNLDKAHRQGARSWDMSGAEQAEDKRDRVRQRSHPDEYSFPTFLARLPSQLTRLAFMFCIEDANSDALIASLRDRTWLPNLRQFEMADSLWMNGEASDDDENEDDVDPDDVADTGFASESLTRTRAEKRALVEACAARGIRLGPRKQHWEDAPHGLELAPRVFVRPQRYEDEDGEAGHGAEQDEWEDYSGESGSDQETSGIEG